MPKIIISERGKEHEQSIECIAETSIGRHADNTVSLDSASISRQHAKVLIEDDGSFLYDLGSGNGTELNGQLVSSKEKHLLRNGDVISIENFDLRFVAPAEQTDETDKEEITESDLLEVKLLKKVLSALDKETSPSFEVLNGVEEAKKVYLTDDIPELVIGRDPECIFPIREHVISRRHAKVSGKWGGIAIRDLESKNGTFVNNRRIVEEYLHDGDRITLGTIVLMFRNPQEVNLAQLEQVPPKNKPQANVNDIPLAENTKAKPPGKSPQKDQTLSKDELKKEKKPVEKSYPTPKAPTKLFERYSPLEIGMIGFGVLFLVFSLITLVNLLFA